MRAEAVLYIAAKFQKWSTFLKVAHSHGYALCGVYSSIVFQNGMPC